MNAYLVVKLDKSESCLYTNLKLAKEKSSSLGNKCFVFEWIDTQGGLWCDPYQASPNTDDEIKFIRDRNHFSWEMLKLARNKGNWHSKIKYPVNGL